jgi:hypothetical protein
MWYQLREQVSQGLQEEEEAPRRVRKLLHSETWKKSGL